MPHLVYSIPRLWVIQKHDQHDYSLCIEETSEQIKRSRDYNELMALAERSTEWL